MKKLSKKRIVILCSSLAIILLFALICYKDIYNLFIFLKNHDGEGADTYLDDISTKAMFVLAGFQFLQIVFAVLPSEFVQVAAFLYFGPIKGFLIIYIAAVLGSCTVYSISKFLKFYKDNDNYDILEEKFRKRNTVFKVLLMYFLPAIPYGVISYYASNKKIGFWRFLLVSMFGVIPSIVLTMAGTGAVKYWYNSSGLVALIVTFVIVLLIIGINSWGKQMDLRYRRNIYHKGDFLFFHFFRKLFKIHFKLHYNLKCDISATKNKKGPYVLLSTHQSAYDFAFASICVGHRRYNCVAARYYFYNKWLKRILIYIGVYPKDLFNQDLSAIRTMMSTIKNNQILLLMPEGRLSTVGYNEEIVESTAKLLKKLNVDVYGCKTEGAYYSLGKGFKKNNRGMIEVSSFPIVTKEELASLSIEEIDKKIKSSLAYDEEAFMDRHPDLQYKHTPSLSKLPGLIYYCPECGGKASFELKKGYIECKCCGVKLKLNKRYEFENDGEKYKYRDLKQIHLHDLQIISDEVKNDNFEITTKVTLKSALGKNNKIIPVGEGVVTYNKDLFTYVGTMNNENIVLKFDAKDLKSIPFGISDGFEIYRNGFFYSFNPIENPNETIRWVMYIESNYKLRYENE